MDSTTTVGTPWRFGPTLNSTSPGFKSSTVAPTIFPRAGYSILSYLMFINAIFSVFNNTLVITVFVKNRTLLNPMNVPPLLGWSSYGPEGVQTSCSLGWEERSWSNYSYLILYTLFCFLLPVAIIIYCYANVLTSMRQLNRSTELQGGRPCLQDNERAVRIVLAMIGAFFVCWLPYTALSVVVVVDPELHIPPLVATMPMYFAKTSPVYNPIIYFLSNKQFRDATLEVLSCGRYISHDPATDTVPMRSMTLRTTVGTRVGRKKQGISAHSRVLPL